MVWGQQAIQNGLGAIPPDGGAPEHGGDGRDRGNVVLGVTGVFPK